VFGQVTENHANAAVDIFDRERITHHDPAKGLKSIYKTASTASLVIETSYGIVECHWDID